MIRMKSCILSAALTALALALTAQISLAATDESYSVTDFKSDCETAGGTASGNNENVYCDFEDGDYISCDVSKGEGGFSTSNCELTTEGASLPTPRRSGTIKGQALAPEKPARALSLPELRQLFQQKAPDTRLRK